ncbi:MAG: hypothetical protein V4437_03055 [Patescibacteria group bacterium]
MSPLCVSNVTLGNVFKPSDVSILQNYSALKTAFQRFNRPSVISLFGPERARVFFIARIALLTASADTCGSVRVPLLNAAKSSFTAASVLLHTKRLMVSRAEARGVALGVPGSI